MKKFILLGALCVLGFIIVTSGVSAKEKEDKGPLTKITFIHYKKDKNPVKPIGVVKPKTTTCYGFLASGAKWKATENYLVNPASSDVGEGTVLAALNAGVQAWETAAGTNIFGEGSLDAAVSYNENSYDDKNTVSFGTYPEANVIAVTNIWGYFGGAPKTRELVEWDMLFNTAFNWGDGAAYPALMDLQNIATHELGHSAGMDDLYTDSCTLETMYGYSTEGDTIKRTLNNGDITGINVLY